MLSISLLHENIDVCLAVIVALILDMAIDVVILRGEIGASSSSDWTSRHKRMCLSENNDTDKP